METAVIFNSNELRCLIADTVSACLDEWQPKGIYSTNHADAKPVTRQQLCEYLGVTPPTIIRWEKRGIIPVMRIGSAARYDIAAVTKALESKNKKR